MVTTLAGLLLLGTMGHYEECPYVTGLPGPCPCGWPKAIAAIEAESGRSALRRNAPRIEATARARGNLLAALEYERGVLDERARVRERVERLQDRREAGLITRAAVLAILEDEE